MLRYLYLDDNTFVFYIYNLLSYSIFSQKFGNILLTQLLCDYYYERHSHVHQEKYKIATEVLKVSISDPLTTTHFNKQNK